MRSVTREPVVEASAPWRRVAILFALASFVELLGFGHLGAFTPLYLEQLGVGRESVPAWTGMLSAVTFVIGLPLAPMWGVWADRYSRKLIIVRSTIGEGLIFLSFGIASEPWHLIVGRMLVGFILGNTGVMYAVLSGVTPRRNLAMAFGVMSAGATMGLTLGPFVGGWLVTQIGLSRLFVIDAVVCCAAGLLVTVFLHEERPSRATPPSTIELLRALPQNLRASPLILPLFGLYFLAFLGPGLQGPFAPLLVADVYRGPDLPVAIGGVMLATGCLSAICSPLLGRLAGTIGTRPVLLAALFGSAATTIGQAFAFDYWSLFAWRAAAGLVQGGFGPLIVSMIALAAPEDRRASVLNLTLFPTNLSHMGGALLGSAMASVSLRGVFVLSGLILAAAGTLSGRLVPRDRSS